MPRGSAARSLLLDSSRRAWRGILAAARRRAALRCPHDPIPQSTEPGSRPMSAPDPLVDVIAGARPNFMKIAPILRAVKARQAAGSRLRVRLVHTGQHYDERMSGDFFGQLGIPDPDVNLEVGSGTQAEQTAAIMVRYEQLLLRGAQRPVPGGRRRHLDDGLRHRRAEAGRAGGARGRRHPLGRLGHAGRDQPPRHRRHHQLVLHHQRGGQRQPAQGGRGRRAHLLRRQHDDRHAAGQPGAAARAGVLGRLPGCSRASTSW